MINRSTLLSDLQKFLQRIEADLLERSESKEVPEVPAALHAEYEKAAKAKRTAQNYEDWRTDTITQAAAAWVLSCVFIRFLEDNSLIDPPKIAGPGERLGRARDEHELYFRSNPKHTDREYLLSIFAELAKLPGTRDIFGEHNAVNDLPNWLSGDAAGELLNFFQKIDAATGELVHDFTDPNWDTRFLGDLYQDLSEAARKKFALLQTPDFVEEFILDRALDPAIEEFGLVPQPPADAPKAPTCFKMIDPACGSGHFLLGAFPRLLERWQRKEPGTNIRELTQRALESIHGVDINPFAVAIAKFRLLLAAMNACNIKRLIDAPGFRIQVACGDSLLHGPNQERRAQERQDLMNFADSATDEELYSHSYPGEDLQIVRALLKPATFHCVVANPPYIVPKDQKLNDWYRKRFSACHGKYSLAVPFLQQIFQLAVQGGFTGQITANSFMKREFGKKLIETVVPAVDLTHVIDTSGAYIPGHGTPTVILFGRNRKAVSATLRAAMGIRGEPSTPITPKLGLVWQSIRSHLDEPGYQNAFISILDSSRGYFHNHPWSIGGGGAAELKENLDNRSSKLSHFVRSVGVMAYSGDDDVFVGQPLSDWQRRGVPLAELQRYVTGDHLRDWFCTTDEYCLFLYDEKSVVLPKISRAASQYLWPFRSILKSGLFFGKTKSQRGMQWYEYAIVMRDRSTRTPVIHFSAVATHNNFVVTRDKIVCNRHSPVVELRPEDHPQQFADIVGVLNSSVVCFWLKQVAHNKGDSTDQHGARTTGDPAFNTFEYSGAMVENIPISKTLPSDRTQSLIELALSIQKYSAYMAIVQHESNLRSSIASCQRSVDAIIAKMISIQEELDWENYLGFELIRDEAEVLTDNPPPLIVGQRAFEIVLARRIAAGEARSTWFERHGSIPITELPTEWPEDYKKLVERRIELIENDPNIRLIEQPEYKRRWNTEPWESQLERALREWLLLRLETYLDFDGRMSEDSPPRHGEGRKGDAGKVGTVNSVPPWSPLSEVAIYSVAQLADAARRDPQFMEVGELYRDDAAFDVQALVEELVLAESVPHLPILRYKDSGLRKRAEWEKTWDLQRREDAGESLGTIPVPPKYISADFFSAGGARNWALRGKLDVPKERWISFPHCEGPDGTLALCWAGYDHLQQAQAISAYYVRVQTEFGGSDDPRLIPLLACLIELLPWLKEWHNDPNPNFDGLRMGDYFEGFVNEEARNLGKTLEEIKAWVPVVTRTKRSAKRTNNP